MKWLRVVAATIIATIGLGLAAAGNDLTIYFIDVEGGQSTLIVTPAGQTVLIDAGWSAFGQRDADRILAAASDAGISRLDYLLVTHFHDDHVGGAAEASRRLPVGTFVDYGKPVETGAFAIVPFLSYAAVREKGQHRVPRPGERLPLEGVEATIVSADRATLTAPLPGGGAATPSCSTFKRQADDAGENARSIGLLVRFGAFRFLDLGDLNWNKLGDLVCPVNTIGTIDLYLVSHHANDDAAVPALLDALRPRALVVNNGPVKGGTRGAMATLHGLPDRPPVWQLHASQNRGAKNSEDALVANLDRGATSFWLKAVASAQGTFSITNARTGMTRTY